MERDGPRCTWLEINFNKNNKESKSSYGLVVRLADLRKLLAQQLSYPHNDQDSSFLDLLRESAQTFSMDLLGKVSQFIKRQEMLSGGDCVLVAVSGGPDSVALLHLLYDLRHELELHLEVAHLQHGIRGAEAQEDARFVAELAEKLGLPFHLKEVESPSNQIGGWKRQSRGAGAGGAVSLFCRRGSGAKSRQNCNCTYAG